MSRIASLHLVAALALASSVSAQGAAQSRVKVGDKVPDFALGSFVMNGDGRQQLADFYGYPILFDFWGTH